MKSRGWSWHSVMVGRHDECRVPRQPPLMKGMRMEKENHLTLKWGTLKSWNFEGNEKALELLAEYNEYGSSFSAMAQRDTPEQKEIICKLIDLMPGEIYLDWDAEYISKTEAKKYVIEYGQKEQRTPPPQEMS